MECRNALRFTADSEDGSTLLHRAARGRKIATVVTVLTRGGDPNKRTRTGSTPLHMAVEGGCARCARALLDAGAEVDALDEAGVSPLLHCVRAAHSYVQSCLRLLISRGCADVDRASDVLLVSEGVSAPLTDEERSDQQTLMAIVKQV
jgi:ankyrin repeat protein